MRGCVAQAWVCCVRVALLLRDAEAGGVVTEGALYLNHSVRLGCCDGVAKTGSL